MKIAILQFNPRLGAVEYNIQQAQRLLDANDAAIELLVLPEMAFSGYNFPSLEVIKPFLEPTTLGPTTKWAIRTARQRRCTVIVGYPEVALETGVNGTSLTRNYNSTVTVAPDGRILNNYRKSFLYYTDELWASEGFQSTETKRPFFMGALGSLGPVGHGICMDINPYRFETPWTDYEFARAMLHSGVKLVVLSMAWLTRLTLDQVQESADKPDMETVAYWLERFFPLLSTHEPIVVVFANRCGSEGTALGSVQVENGETIETGDRVAYAGSSCVMRFQNDTVKLWDRHGGSRKNEVALMGKGEEGLLVVETSVGAGFLLQQGV